MTLYSLIQSDNYNILRGPARAVVVFDVQKTYQKNANFHPDSEITTHHWIHCTTTRCTTPPKKQAVPFFIAGEMYIDQVASTAVGSADSHRSPPVQVLRVARTATPTPRASSASSHRDVALGAELYISFETFWL